MNELKLIEKELVPVYETSTGEKVVNGRELWTVLKSKRQFANWINERLKDCDASENIGYVLNLLKVLIKVPIKIWTLIIKSIIILYTMINFKHINQQFLYTTKILIMNRFLKF